jgi:hypothetical protein
LTQIKRWRVLVLVADGARVVAYPHGNRRAVHSCRGPRRRSMRLTSGRFKCRLMLPTEDVIEHGYDCKYEKYPRKRNRGNEPQVLET